MKRRYNRTFDFFDTLDQALDFADEYMRTAKAYQKQKYPAKVTPWNTYDTDTGEIKERKYVVWYAYEI